MVRKKYLVLLAVLCFVMWFVFCYFISLVYVEGLVTFEFGLLVFGSFIFYISGCLCVLKIVEDW